MGGTGSAHNRVRRGIMQETRGLNMRVGREGVEEEMG